jgi:hypothetical protein
MHGEGGTDRRRTIIVVEFVLGAVAGPAVGVYTFLTADGLGWQIFGAWLTLVMLNYVPLMLHAFSLLRPGALSEELAGVDIPRGLRRYTLLQLWIVVPLLFVVLAVPRALGRRPV